MKKPNYNKSNKLKVFTAFSGYDSQCLGLERLKEYSSDFDYDLVGWSEINKWSCIAHNALFPQFSERNYGDISKIDWKNVPDFDLFTYSSPCFVAGTRVLTNRGYINIEDVYYDDYVLTHTNTFKKVIVPMYRQYKGDMMEINTTFFKTIECTAEHPFYVREKKGTEFKKPIWKYAERLSGQEDWLGMAINQESKFPELDTEKYSEKFISLLKDPDFWYIIGVYVRHGFWRSYTKDIHIAYTDDNQHSLIASINKCGCIPVIYENGAILIKSKELYEFVKRYDNPENDDFEYEKTIDYDTMCLPVDCLKAFLNGFNVNDLCRINKENDLLIYSLQQCVAKVYHTLLINSSENPYKNRTFYEDGHIWFPIANIVKYYSHVDVYNLEVQEDHSYTANCCICHNCQDWSTAGCMKGGERDTGTRSSLLWECEKAINIKRPKFCLLENVIALVSKKFIGYFEEWISLLKTYGYKSYWTVLNAKDFGVPQNRPRVFLVSVHESADVDSYTFPQPLGDDARGELYEILVPDDEVDPKFFRTEKRKLHYLELNKEAMKRLNVPENEVPGLYDMKPMGLNCHSTDKFNTPPLYNLSRTLKVESIECGIIYKKDGEWYERLFTYKELFRLMGLKDSEYDILYKNVTSTTNLQRMAGNSIVVNVLFHIFRKMFVDTDADIGQSSPLF